MLISHALIIPNSLNRETYNIINICVFFMTIRCNNTFQIFQVKMSFRHFFNGKQLDNFQY